MFSFSKGELECASLVGKIGQYLTNKNLQEIGIFYGKTYNNSISEFRLTENPQIIAIKVEICNPDILKTIFNQLNTFLKENEDHQLLALDVICNPALFSNELKELLSAVGKFFGSMLTLEEEMEEKSKTIIRHFKISPCEPLSFDKLEIFKNKHLNALKEKSEKVHALKGI